jgi:predicted DNA-binding transcriptional regulator AlpA
MVEQRHPAESGRRGTRSQHSDLSDLSDECLITSKPVRHLVGNCSEMHIWRLLNEEKYQALAFPKPIKINDRNYWRLAAVRQWIRDQEAQSQKVSPGKGGGELAPDGEAPFVSQKRPRPVARRTSPSLVRLPLTSRCQPA